MTYFHRTRTKSVLKFRILLITESFVLRKGSFPIIGQHFYHFFSFEKLLSHETHNKIIFKVTDFFYFFYECFALFLHSSFCIHSAPFSTSVYILSYFSHAKKSLDIIITLAYFDLHVQILCNFMATFIRNMVLFASCPPVFTHL